MAMTGNSGQNPYGRLKGLIVRKARVAVMGVGRAWLPLAVHAADGGDARDVVKGENLPDNVVTWL